MVSLSERREVALLLDIFRGTWDDALHVGVLQNFDIIVFVVDNVFVGSVMVFLHNAIEHAVSREEFGNRFDKPAIAFIAVVRVCLVENFGCRLCTRTVWLM